MTVIATRRNEEEVLKTVSEINNLGEMKTFVNVKVKESNLNYLLGFPGKCHGFGVDFRKEESVQNLLEKVCTITILLQEALLIMTLYYLRNPLGCHWINVMTAICCVKVEADYGPLLCAVHNIGANIGHVPLAHTSTRVYTKVSRICQ